MLTTGQLAAALGFDAKTVANWTDDGTIPPETFFRTPKGHRRFRPAAILAWAKSRGLDVAPSLVAAAEAAAA